MNFILPDSLSETRAPVYWGFSRSEEQDSEEKQILDNIRSGSGTNI